MIYLSVTSRPPGHRVTSNNYVTNVICLPTQCPGQTHGVTYDVTWARGEDNQSRGVSEDCGQLTLALLASVMLSARLRDGARVEARGDQAIMALSSQHSWH